MIKTSAARLCLPGNLTGATYRHLTPHLPVVTTFPDHFSADPPVSHIEKNSWRAQYVNALNEWLDWYQQPSEKPTMINELGDNLIPLFAIVCGCTAFVIWIIAATVESIYETARNAKLKERMMDQGFSAAEIAAIISGKPLKSHESMGSAPVPPVKNRHALRTGQTS